MEFTLSNYFSHYAVYVHQAFTARFEGTPEIEEALRDTHNCCLAWEQSKQETLEEKSER